ncbi:MAG: hypothetical protein VB817_06245 [Pirellulaceae bacterium]
MNGPARDGSLVFIYNARSGNLQALLDLVHKTLSPATYRCALCQLTYTFRMRQQWREYLEGLPWDIEFRYFDQLVEEARMLAGTLPACLLKSGNHRQLLLDADMINSCQDVAGLIVLLEEQLARL